MKKPAGILALLVAFLAASAAAISLSSCGSVLPTEDADLTPPLIASSGVGYSTDTAKKGSIKNTIGGSGTVTAQSRSSAVFLGDKGYLKKIHVATGDIVKKGTLIADLYNNDLTEQYELQKLNFHKSTLAFEKQQKLFQSGEIDKYDFGIAKVDYQIAKIQFETYARSESYLHIYASTGGQVVYVADLSAGDGVSKNQAVATIADLQKLYVSYGGSGYDEIPLGARVTLALDGGKKLGGTVTATPDSMPASAGDDEKKEVLITPSSKLPSDAALGSSVTVSYLAAEHKDVVLIPKDDLSVIAGSDFVYVLQDGIKSQRSVKVGLTDNRYAEITSGLEAGETVIAR